MRYILLAIVLTGAAFGIATTTVHAQLAIGPDGVHSGQPHHRFYGNQHMRYDRYRDRHGRVFHRPPVMPDRDYDEDEE